MPPRQHDRSQERHENVRTALNYNSAKMEGDYNNTAILFYLQLGMSISVLNAPATGIGAPRIHKPYPKLTRTVPQ